MVTKQDKTLLVVTPYSPNVSPEALFSVPLGLAGNPVFDKVSGSGGWQIVERPKQKAATQWYDESPYQLTIEAIIDPTVTRSAHTPDQDVAQLISWMRVPTLRASVIEPPTLSLSGPVLGTDLTWVVYSIKWGEAIRVPPGIANTDTGGTPADLRLGEAGIDWRQFGYNAYGDAGSLMQQMLTLTLYEYVPPFPSSHHTSSPAKNAVKRNASGSHKTYTIKAGDTLASIAAREMGKASVENEQDIIAANKGDASLKLRSPRQILSSLVGKTIKIPAA